MQKLFFKTRTFQVYPKLTGSYKMLCNTVIVKVVIIQIWTIWTIQIKRSNTAYQLRSYHIQDRSVPDKHGGIKSPVFIGHHEVSKFHLQVLWQFSFFTLNIKTEGRIFESVYWILKMCPLFIRMLTVILIMLICSSFIRLNMLRAHLKMNFVFGTNTDEYKGSLCI